jgi:hypothetical protein
VAEIDVYVGGRSTRIALRSGTGDTNYLSIELIDAAENGHVPNKASPNICCRMGSVIGRRCDNVLRLGDRGSRDGG